MNPFTVEVVALVDAAGGLTTYPELLAAVAPERRPELPRALKEAKRSGALFQQVFFDPETGVNTHKLWTVGHAPV